MVDFGLPPGLSEVMANLIEQSPVVAGAMRRLQEGDHAGSAERLRVAVQSFGEGEQQARLKAILGYCNLKLADYHEAAAELQDSTAALAAVAGEGFNSSTPSLLAMKHAGELESDNIDALEATYAIVIALDHPRFRARAMVNQGDLLYHRKNRPAEARAHWEKVLVIADDDVDKAFAAYNLGWYWQERSDLPKAHEYYRSTIDLAPSSIAAEHARRDLGT